MAKKKAGGALQNSRFQAGTLVEVSLYDDGFWGSWYTGTVIRCLSHKTPNKYLVQYDKLFKDESGKKPLKEVLDVFQLRPIAPREKRMDFKFSNKVDAYYKEGWWEGVITEECGDGKFAVFFKTTKEQIVFGQEDMRLHREWVDGKWEPPLEEENEKIEKVEETCKINEMQNSPIFMEAKPNKGTKRKRTDSTGMLPNEEVARSIFIGAEIEVSSEEDGFQGAWFSATVVECLGNKRYLVEYQKLRTEDDSSFLREEIDAVHVRPSPPETIMVDRFKVMEEVDAFYNDGWWAGVIAKVLADSRYTVYFRTTGEEMKFVHAELRPHQDWIAGKWFVPSQALKL